MVNQRGKLSTGCGIGPDMFGQIGGNLRRIRPRAQDADQIEQQTKTDRRAG